MTVASLILGRYRLEHEIAVGGTARVWRARDEQLDRWVAVKMLHPHLLPDETSRQRLEAEARAAATLSHPGIATVFDVTGAGEEPALVMELVDGEPLSRLLAKDGPMRPDAAARLAAEVAEALYHAHQQGIVHRDVKPANILVESGTGRARLIDFGIAHSLELAALPLTQTGTALGTPRYMAPEQLAAEPVGPRTDLWGLGAVLYEALTGRPQFDGSTPLAIARQQAAGPPAMADVDPALAALISSCLSVAIDDRPLHAGAMAASLRAWLAGDEVPTMAIPVQAPVQRDQPSSRRRPLAIAAVALVIVIGLVGTGLALNGRQPQTPVASSPEPTPQPTPNWRAPLLAEYREACGASLDRSELSGLTRAEASELVDKRVQDCRDEGNGKGNGKGRGGDHGRD
ncbi:MAG TPA: serine/threonine-protein kinase [Candidatus Limnocylindrales bacterium]|nr:serine/threonine-protein kinase [Candidatus Limnocylindrales bacterium]